MLFRSGFAKAGESTQNFYVHASAVRSAFEREYGLRDDELKSLYASGPSASGVYCLRGILVADRTKADEASFRLAAGDEFAKVATELSTDATAKNGGILQNPQTGKACIDQAALASQVGPEFISALAGVGIDQPTTPFEIPNVGWEIGRAHV